VRGEEEALTRPARGFNETAAVTPFAAGKRRYVLQADRRRSEGER